MEMRIFYIVCIILAGCKNHKPNSIRLHYDFYRHDSLEKANALTIEYKQIDTGITRTVDIVSRVDTNKIIFKEKVNDNGIYRSVDGSDFNLTHSFTIGRNVESHLPKSYPIFINTWAKGIMKKNYLLTNNDSINIIFFDETIPFYTFTSSYYSKELGFFIVYYNQHQDTYFKLSKAEGLQNNYGEKDILRVTNKLSNDTMFFGKHYKLPIVPQPPLKE